MPCTTSGVKALPSMMPRMATNTRRRPGISATRTPAIAAIVVAAIAPSIQGSGRLSR